ncbi:MAG: HD domain-containing protein [bacterium]|nr:HD domain-containing protein [bacterium]
MLIILPTAIIIAGVINFVLGFFIHYQARPGSFNRALEIFAFITSAWCFSNYILSVFPSLFWFQTSYALGALVLASALIWVSGFPDRTIYKKDIFIFGILGLIFAALCYRDNLLISKGQPGILIGVYGLYMAALFIFLIVKIFRHYLKAADLSEKKRSYYIFWGAFVFAAASFVLAIVLPLFRITKYSTLSSPFSLFFAGAMVLSIFRYQLMDIKIVLRKGFVHAILSGAITALWVIIVVAIERTLRTFTGYASLLTVVIAAVTITATFQPLKNKVEIFVDKIFFRGRYDYHEALAEFTRTLISILDLRELLNLIVSMSGILGSKQISIMLFDAETSYFKIRSSLNLDKISKAIELDAQSDLVSMLKSTKGVIIKEEIEKLPERTAYQIIKEEMESLQAAISIPIFIKGELYGILSLGNKLSGEIYNREDVNLLQTLADEAGIAIENARLYGDLKRTYFETVQALAQAIEASDKYTRGHSDRVTHIAMEIAKHLKLSRTDIDTLKYACILHDVGKIGVMKEILNKPGQLTPEEFEQIKMHPALGEEIISPVAFLVNIKPIIRHHHERYDGNGYPDKIKSDRIPFLSRIIAVADTYDAMTSQRPYRPALSEEMALAEIRNCSGTQFDPEVVKAFLEIHPNL